MIIDTDVLIWEFRGNHQAQLIIHQNLPFCISVVTYIELIQGMRNRQELKTLSRQLSKYNVTILQIDSDISTRAMLYVEDYFFNHSMLLADALIAATCVQYGETLITANDKHYSYIPDIQVLRFEPNV